MKMADMGMKVEYTMARKIYKDFPGSFEGSEDMYSSLQNTEFSKLERTGVMSLLEDCIAQLQILGKSNKRTTVPSDIHYRSLKDRYMNS
jgi:hypothetical protein